MAMESNLLTTSVFVIFCKNFIGSEFHYMSCSKTSTRFFSVVMSGICHRLDTMKLVVISLLLATL